MQGIVPKRIVIYAKDVENITGRKERTARRLLQKIRRNYGKPKEAFITITEFCEYTGLKIDQVAHFLIN
jgi:hypothetical protein